MKTRKGFTLLELLIVIGILAILSTTIVLVINPAELLRKARDSQRISDLSALKTAIAYYVTDVANPNIGPMGSTFSTVASSVCFGGSSTSTALTVDGLGWIPINFATTTGGSPIGSLPRDPNQSTSAGATPGYYYIYGVKSATNCTFKLVANMESTYYSNGGAGDVESRDGGTDLFLYEVGTDLTIPIASSSDACFKGR